MHNKGSFMFRLTAGPLYVVSINLTANMTIFLLAVHGEKNASQKIASASDSNTFDSPDMCTAKYSCIEITVELKGGEEAGIPKVLVKHLKSICMPTVILMNARCALSIFPVNRAVHILLSMP